MRKLKFKELTAESFQNYGTFSNLINPRAVKIGEEPCEFFRDILQLNLGPASIASYSVCRLLSRDRIITNAEFHSYCSEGIFAIDGEVLMPVAIATRNGAFNPGSFEVFRVPKGTMLVLKPGVWHCAAFVHKSDCVNLLITLPERTYANDCNVIEIPVDEQIEVID